jgi:GDP-D-mannose 3', 5'-epimerase
MSKILVTGAGGFIGSWLVKRLKADGHWVRGVDLKYPEYDESPADQFDIMDLRSAPLAQMAAENVDEIFLLLRRWEELVSYPHIWPNAPETMFSLT